MKLAGRASCLLTHRWIFASGPYFGSRSPVQQGLLSTAAALPPKQIPSRAFRIWLTPVKQGTSGIQSLRHSAGTSGIHGHGWQVEETIYFGVQKRLKNPS
ncbi:unnamed protein product [Pipistrellus nathusii]|uniref:Uncharacterized protein n=1 Tax=Pipistrellus nathusii TaxID=59473 RepID=A0ABN9ZJB5_PIPNA